MKLFAGALPVTLTRYAGYRAAARPARTWTRTRTPVSWRQFGELAPRVLIVTLFSSMAFRLGRDFLATGHVTGLLLMVSEALVVVLTLVRRNAGTVDRSWKARLLTGFATFGPSLVIPVTVAAALPEVVTVVVAVAGIFIVVCGKLSLGRSFGLAPANRGVVSSGMYRFARHPIYLGYLITHLAFLMANPIGWNLAVLAATDIALMFRAVCEEQTLALDPAYRSYMQRVRWRILPKVF